VHSKHFGIMTNPLKNIETATFQDKFLPGQLKKQPLGTVVLLWQGPHFGGNDSKNLRTPHFYFL